MLARDVSFQRRGISAQRRRISPKTLAGYLPLAGMLALYVARFGLLSVQVQDGFGAPGYDLGIFDQGVWLLSRFDAPFVTVMGRNLFGDHTSFVLLLVVPFYWLWPTAQTLLIIQTVLLAGAAVPIFVLARRRLGGVWMPSALAAAYLLNPALQRGNLEQFHPECFLVAFLALAILAALEWWPRLLLVCVVGALLVKEDTALLVIPLGVWVYFRRDRAWGAGIAVAAAAYMAFAFEVVIRALLGTAAFYGNRIPFGGLAGLVESPFVHPGKLWAYLTSGGRPYYLWQMGASFGWVFLASPEIAAIAVLNLAENVVSNFPYMHQIPYHYSLDAVPVLAMGTVFAISRLASTTRRAVASFAVVSFAVISCYLWGLSPFSLNPTYPHLTPAGAAVTAADRALSVIPADAVVSAGDFYVSHLDHRKYIYQWPTPFYARYWGLYDEEGTRLPFASKVQYLAVPTVMTGTDKAVFESIASKFRLVASGGGLSVYRRVPPKATSR
ncbi:MAG: DUF2079 domain-containing protein [Acidimicrobiales bacterium]